MHGLASFVMRGRSQAALVAAVAAYADTDPLALPRLYDVVDPDALDALIASMAEGQVAFEYAGCTVTVDSDSRVDVSESGTDGKSSIGGI
jgi:hypothetical protein